MFAKLQKYRYELSSIALCVTLGMLSGYLSHAGSNHWYLALQKPNFTPPSWVFRPVWIILYSILGIILGQLLRNRNQYKIALYWFATQMLCNLLWSPLFFGFGQIKLAWYMSILLCFSTIVLMIHLRRRPILIALLLPYLAWISFACLINYHIAQHNPNYISAHQL